MNTLPMNELRISITSRCNMNCSYCHNEGNKVLNDIDIDLLDKLIDVSLKYGLKSVRITGGEPLLHNNIDKICKLIKTKSNNIQIGINTNGILIDKLCSLIENKLIDRVVIGIDYFDNIVSKNSKIGIPSKQVLDNLLKLKKYNIDLSISTTYDNDYNNIKNLTKWSIDNDIRIKILEIVDNKINDNTSYGYLKMQEQLIKDFNLDIKLDKLLNEKHGFINDKKVVSFYHSHCKLRECDYCRNMHLRVMSTNKFKPCLLNEETEIEFNKNNIEKQLVKSLNKLGIPPR